MKRILLFTISLLTLGLSPVWAQRSKNKLQPDPHVEKYLNPMFKMKANAVYFSPYDLIMNKSIGVGYQRKINNKLWAEGGLQIGTGTLAVADEVRRVLTYPMLTVPEGKTSSSGGLIYIDDGTDSITMNTNFHATIYKNMFGAPVINALAYGLELNYGSYDYIYYTYSVRKETNMSVFNPMLSWAYKTILYGPVGFDFTMHGGLAFVSHKKDSDTHNMVAGLHYTKLNYNLQLKIFVAF